MYGALLDNGVAMGDIDRMEYGLYMQIVRERAARRARRDRKRPGGAQPQGGNGSTVELRRGYIDDVW